MTFSSETIDAMELELVRNGGMVLAACVQLRLDPLGFERACAEDAALAVRIIAARRVAASALEQEAWRRIFGEDERSRGSDTLLFKMMERRLPDLYGDTVAVVGKADHSWGDQAPTASPDDDFGQVPVFREDVQ